jgi:hypothetical protein
MTRRPIPVLAALALAVLLAVTGLARAADAVAMAADATAMAADICGDAPTGDAGDGPCAMPCLDCLGAADGVDLRGPGRVAVVPPPPTRVTAIPRPAVRPVTSHLRPPLRGPPHGA